jgi:hypothetical protein
MSSWKQRPEPTSIPSSGRPVGKGIDLVAVVMAGIVVAAAGCFLWYLWP